VSSSDTDTRVHATPQQSGKIICHNLIHLVACATHGRSSLRNGKAHFHPVNILKAHSSDWNLCCPWRDHVVGFRAKPWDINSSASTIHSNVYGNRDVAAGLSLGGINWGFTHMIAGNWHPITTISHMLDCQLYGLNA